MDLLSDSTGNDMVMMTIKNFDFLDNEIEEYEVWIKLIIWAWHEISINVAFWHERLRQACAASFLA